MSYDYEIVRHKQSNYSTLGRLYDSRGQEIVVTLERPWVDVNKDQHRDRYVSRFEPGTFRAILRLSHLLHQGGTGGRNYDLWEFVDVPDINDGQLHIANFPWDLKGCIGVGTAFGKVFYKGDTVTDGVHSRIHGLEYDGISGSTTAHKKWMKDTLALCAKEARDYIIIKVTDRFA